MEEKGLSPAESRLLLGQKGEISLHYNETKGKRRSILMKGKYVL